MTISSAVVGVPMKKRDDPLSFDDEGKGSVKKLAGGLEDATEDENYGMDDDDWMIDDIGLLDKPDKERDKSEKGYAREMGTSFQTSSFLHLFISHSERYKGSTSIPAGINANGQQEEISWCANLNNLYLNLLINCVYIF